MATRKNNRKSRRSQTRKQNGGRKMSSWNMLVKRTFEEMRRKDRRATFSDALKEAARRKSEM